MTHYQLAPGVQLRCFPDNRFKQGCLSFQIVRPMSREEASLNALLPAVLLRGTRRHPDLRSITMHLDDLYGGTVSTLVRRVGDYQTTGVSCGFMDDRFALDGDQVLAPMMDFLREILLEPLVENSGFIPDFVDSEKKNLVATIESDLNNKQVYAMGRLLRTMCREDSFGVPRLGYKEDVAAIDPVGLYEHYQKILRQSRLDIFYVGTAAPEAVADMLRPILESIDRDYVNPPAQTPFSSGAKEDLVETMDVTQGKLCLGYTTPITTGHPDFAAMQVANSIFGAGMTSKLFMNVREKMSLCYSIGSGYYGTKGIITVSAGIDFDKEAVTRQEIENQLDACRRGSISAEELNAAKESILSGLRSTHDSPGAIEGFYASAALSGLGMDPDAYMQAIAAVSADQVARAAATLQLHTTYFLKGEPHEEI